MLSRCFIDFSVGVGAFVIGLSQISSLFLLHYHKPNLCSVDIFKRICSSPVAPIPTYRIRTISVAYWPRV